MTFLFYVKPLLPLEPEITSNDSEKRYLQYSYNCTKNINC